MEKQEYYKYSKYTGKEYNLFNTIIIINPLQSAFYESEGVHFVENELSIDRKTGRPIWTWVYIKDETKDVFDKWCKLKE